MRYVLSLLALVGVAFGQTVTITNVPNAAIPAIDYPTGWVLVVPPRSILSIFGTNLADTTATAVPPWKSTLGGIELHLCFNCTASDATPSPTEFVATLLYVSPTQVNFVVPDVPPDDIHQSYRLVIIRNGQRYTSDRYW